MKILLIYPDHGTDVMSFCSAIHVLSAVLKREGHSVSLIHINNENGVKYDKETIVKLSYGYDLFAVTSTSFSYKYANEIAGWLKKAYPEVLSILGGSHATIQPEDFESSSFDIFCIGEGDEAIKELCHALDTGSDYTKIPSLITRFGQNPIRKFLKNMDDLPFWDFDVMDTEKILNLRQHWLTILFARGCPFSCLQGDTLIDTTEGYFKIKDLIGKTPKVLTRNPLTYKPEYAQVKEVKLTRRNAELIRVKFDNGDFIDCTPDHKFMTFKNGNQFVDTDEKEVQAQNLKIGESVRAIHYEKEKQGYIAIVWGRRKRIKQHRLVVESKIGRKLKRNEPIHHLDFNKENNTESNLVITDKNHLTLFHPELSERMKTNNAAKNMTHEQRVALGKSQLGKTRSLESRINYRNSKLGTKNPQYKHGKSKYNVSRIKEDLSEVNHKILSIQKLEKKEDVYCMEVPGYDWFYANGVFVHNCTFCINHLYKKIEMGKGDKMSEYIRKRSPELCIDELEILAKKFSVKVFNVADDLLTLDKKWLRKFTEGYKERIYKPFGIKYSLNARADSLTDEVVKMLSESGCMEARIGFETGNEKIRNELLRKKTTNRALFSAFEAINKYGVNAVAFTMMGLPGESYETFQETIEMINKLKPRLIRMTFLFPYKNTKIYDICYERKLFKENYMDEDNRDNISPLKFENLTDQELFCFKFLFPWYVNTILVQGEMRDVYSDAIKYFKQFTFEKLRTLTGSIIEQDTFLSSRCKEPHYKYFSDQLSYFQLYKPKIGTDTI